MRQYYGKYRGKVENNVDPMQLGRIQVSVPTVLGDGTLSWAMPCAPFAGSGVGFFAVPPNGANVWVEFEEGDPGRPIWVGGFWGIGEVPAMPALAEVKVFKTETATLTMSDLPGVGGITLELNTGMKIVMDSLKLEITNGQGATIQMQGPQISANNGALEIV